MSRVRSLRIVKLRVCAPVSPMTVSGKSLGGPVTNGSGNELPTPLRSITSGPLVAFELMVSVAVRGPNAAGVKVTVSVHVPAGSTGGPDVHVMPTPNSPGLLPPRAATAVGSVVNDSGALPLLVMTCITDLGTPSWLDAKSSSRLGGFDGLICGRVPVPCRVTSRGAPGLGVMRNVLLVSPATVGVKRSQRWHDWPFTRVGEVEQDPAGKIC